MGFNTAASIKNSRAKSKVSKVPRSISRSARAWHQFPIGGVAPITYARRRIRRAGAPDYLPLQFPGGVVQTYARRRGAAAPVFLSAIREHLAAEGLEQLAQNEAEDKKKIKIGPTHIQVAVRGDDELSKLSEGVTVANGGPMPNLHQNMLSESSGKKEKEFGAGLQ